MKFQTAPTNIRGMDEVDVVLEFELSEDVSDASRYSLAIQVGEVIAKAIEEKELELPDGDIEDFNVHYETDDIGLDFG